MSDADQKRTIESALNAFAAQPLKASAGLFNALGYHNHSAWSFVARRYLSGVRNNSLKKIACNRGERVRPDLPK